MTRTAAEAERDVEASRNELDRTVEALKDRMTPGQLFDEAMHTMSDSGSEVFGKLTEQAKANPLPIAVIGIGVAWLLSSSARDRTQADRAFSPAGSTVDGVAGKASAAKAGAAQAFASAQEGLSDAKDSISETVSGALHGAQDGVSRLSSGASAAAGQAGEYGQQARRTILDLIDQEPLLIGGAGLLIGLALGAAMPPTETEKRALGPLADRVIDQSRSFAQERLEDAQDVASAAFDAAKEAAKDATAGSQTAAPNQPSTAATQH